MTWRLHFRTTIVIGLLGSSLAAFPFDSRASDPVPLDCVPLDRATIVVDSNQPSFVQYGVEDLAGYLQESTGNKVPVLAAADGGTNVRILVGAEAVGRVFPNVFPLGASLTSPGMKPMCCEWLTRVRQPT